MRRFAIILVNEGKVIYSCLVLAWVFLVEQYRTLYVFIVGFVVIGVAVAIIATAEYYVRETISHRAIREMVNFYSQINADSPLFYFFEKRTTDFLKSYIEQTVRKWISNGRPKQLGIDTLASFIIIDYERRDFIVK